MTNWREKFRSVISRQIEEIGLKKEARLDKKLDDIYEKNFGRNEGHLRRMWLAEVKYQKEWYRTREIAS
jgi:hypothetical protein